MLNDLRVVRFRYNQRDLRPVLAELVVNVAGLLLTGARVLAKLSLVCS